MYLLVFYFALYSWLAILINVPQNMIEFLEIENKGSRIFEFGTSLKKFLGALLPLLCTDFIKPNKVPSPGAFLENYSF